MPPRPRLRWYHLFVPFLAVLLPVALWRLADQPLAVRLDGERWVRDSGSYAGVEACRECHQALVELQVGSNHARTCRDLRREPPLAPFDGKRAVIDPFAGARYTMERERGRPAIVVTQGALRASQPLDYEFGSGAHAHGYIAKVDAGGWIDARLNYYRKILNWDFTSGQEKPHAYLRTQPLGRPQPPAEIVRCFTCHSTVVRADGARKLPDDDSQLRVRPDRSVLGVTCESCHGPQADHVRERRANLPVVRRPRLSAEDWNRICGRCHGMENVNPAHPVITRFQPWGLSQSRCFKGSGGRLSCMTCHDPHTDAVKGDVFYERKCLDCHPGAGGAGRTLVCPVNRKAGCVGCHMPRDSKSMLHITFTDHRIRVTEAREGMGEWGNGRMGESAIRRPAPDPSKEFRKIGRDAPAASPS